jgi:dienelactone hydrolase
MNMPEWLKPGIYGVIVGAAAISVVGFSWGGWVTGSMAAKMATTKAHDEVIAALVPVCLKNSRLDTSRMEKLAKIKEATSYKRRDVVMETGWATLPGSDKADRDLAQACIEGLDLDAS